MQPPVVPLRNCGCFNQAPASHPVRKRVAFHAERQDTTALAWRKLQSLINEAAKDRRHEFRPLAVLSVAERTQIVTLPPEIAKLTTVRHLYLYGSYLVRLPPEIGQMASLEQLTVYTSYRLHWFPYELTRCRNLAHGSVSIRAIYGNRHYRPPFPALPTKPNSARGIELTDLDPGTWGTTRATHCSVCALPIVDELRQVWISLRVWRDGVPLLVNACSSACIEALPTPPSGFVPHPHHGGPALVQPPPTYL